MKKLYRSTTDNYIFGILGGLGEYFEIDPTVLRLLFIFFVLITGFFPGGLAYLVAYFIVPENPKDVAAKIHAEKSHKEDKHDENKDGKDNAEVETELL